MMLVVGSLNSWPIRNMLLNVKLLFIYGRVITCVTKSMLVDHDPPQETSRHACTRLLEPGVLTFSKGKSQKQSSWLGVIDYSQTFRFSTGSVVQSAA
jgi:hypothetical protein